MVASSTAPSSPGTSPGETRQQVGDEEGVRVLLVEDREAEAELTVRELRRSGLIFTWVRVWTELSLRAAVRDFQPTIVLSDFTLPGFDGLNALKVIREIAPELPFIFVSGTIGEERAIEALRGGADDYVLKSNLLRLGAAVDRALEDARTRQEQRRQQAQISHLTRVLRMLSGINGLIVHIHDRNELLAEACRLAVSAGGYTAALVLLQNEERVELQPVAYDGVDPPTVDILRTLVLDAIARDSVYLQEVMQEGRAFVCNDTAEMQTTDAARALMTKAGFRAAVALPLQLDRSVVGAFVLCGREAGSVSGEEQKMLEEVAANLSFALQYLQRDDAVQFLSYFDPLTGLAKRSLFCERLQRQLRQDAARTRPAVAVADIEQLSVINDSIGRPLADRLLQQVAERLRRRGLDSECLAHLSGGTFAIVLQGGTGPSEANRGLQELLGAVFGPPFEVPGNSLPIAARSGLALYPEDGADADTLVQNAEAALRDAKASGQRHLHYSTQQRSELLARLELEHLLRTAIERRQFELHYQPKVNLATRHVEGVEALLRWRHPQSGLVAPAAFLPLLESTGLIIPAGRWVIEQAAKDCQQWQQRGLPAVRIAVNISPAELRQPEFADYFLSMTEAWNSLQWGLDVEITEGALLGDNSGEVAALKRLRGAGVRIAIDDFGTGYSSLSRLSDLPIDTLKIDRTFIMRLPDDVPGRTLVSTIIMLAHTFGMTVVAEGVETMPQFTVLKDLGCDQIQGYLFSKPVPAESLIKLLDQECNA